MKLVLVSLCVLICAGEARADESGPAVISSDDSNPATGSKLAVPRGDSSSYLRYIRARAKKLREGSSLPRTISDWKVRKTSLRTRLRSSWGEFPKVACPLEAKTLGVIDGDGYSIERLVFQTMPKVWMTANAYVPDVKGRRPAVLCVHGHWSGAKQHSVVQARCIGLAKLGFFVLVVDAFGAGERGLGKALGEYHGEMVAATLIPSGKLLAGIQVYENMRAVDYLQSRPEVDPDRIGITGASGGGNQSMFAGAWDERIRSVAPTCSVGNFQAYLGVACCMCETIPGALEFAEEDEILGMVAPRSLLVMNATQDGIQFSVGQANVSLRGARDVFRLLGASGNIRHSVFESRHDYNRPMRETMYGWMQAKLSGLGAADPIAEPSLKLLDPEKLRCYPGDSRPEGWVTLPRFAAKEAQRLVARISRPKNLAGLRSQLESMRAAWNRKLTSSELSRSEIAAEVDERDGGVVDFRFESEPLMPVRARVERGSIRKTLLVIDMNGFESASSSAVARSARQAGVTLVFLELRATGQTALRRDRIGRAPDHTSAQWALWTGRTLLEQWVFDLRRTLDVLADFDAALVDDVSVVGIGPAGIVALGASVSDNRIEAVATLGALSSFVANAPYEGQRLGILVPGILRDLGDVQHIAALTAPKALFIGGAVDAVGRDLKGDELDSAFSFTRRAYELMSNRNRLQIAAQPTAKAVVDWLTQVDRATIER